MIECCLLFEDEREVRSCEGVEAGANVGLCLIGRRKA